MQLTSSPIRLICKEKNWLILLITILAGCSSLPVLPTDDAKLPSIMTSFSFEGRLTVRHDNESLAGKIFWSHQPSKDQITLLTPFGQQVAAIIRNNDLYRLTDGKTVIESDDIQSLMIEQLGYALPVASMPAWVLGIPAIPFVRQQQPLPFRTDDNHWTLSYEEYKVQGGYLLPTIMTFSTQSLTIRLIVSHWKIKT